MPSYVETVDTYNLLNIPNVANSNGERPIESMMIVASIKLVEWLLCERNWHIAPAMRTTQRINV